MRLRALLETGSLGLRLLGGEEELDRTVRGVMTTDLRDPTRYLSGGELVLTGLAWRQSPEDSEPFVRVLAAAGVAALAAGEAETGPVPGDLVAACARHRLPLFSVCEEVAFAAITEHVTRRISGERAGDLAAVVERHRLLVDSGRAGGGPEAVLGLLGSDLDLRAWVLSPTGRAIAEPSGAALPATLRERLAGEHLAAVRRGLRGPYRVRTGGTAFSLFPVRHGDREPQETVLSDWLLAVEADAGEWPAERLELLHGVTQLIAAERGRRDTARAVHRRLAQEVLALVRADAPATEVAARLRVAAPVLVPEPGPGEEVRWQVVVARIDWAGDERHGEGPATRSLLEEVLADPRTGRPAGPGAVGHTDGEAVALVPLSAAPAAPESPAVRAAGLAAVSRGLVHALAEDGRLTFGVSAAVDSAEGLRGALEEARHARRVAAARPGRASAASHEELASHVLLLPFVPDDVRRVFAARLLAPLREYDRRHRADLVPTLRAFLDCDSSWTRCATRLHVHVNTLRYRIGRIEQLTGRDLSRLEDKVDFFLALRLG